jgi:PAS domain S-box-containing protein
MERQSSFSRGVRLGRSLSAGAAVLERPEHERPTTKNGNGAGRGAVDQELFADYAGQVAAIRKSQAVIEFAMDGTILDANDNLLEMVGCTLDEIKGRHHSMFVDQAYRQSYEYKEFWAALNRGECRAEEYKRLGKGGKEIWIEASYNPILDFNGKPFKVINYSTDITPRKVALNAMLADVTLLTQAAVEGKLATRADASRHQGEYRKVVEGVNSMLDAVIGPLNVSAEYVDRISKGDIPPRITDNYNGDFNEIKNNLNVCIDAVSALVADGVGLTQSMLDGKLAARADASKHQGDFRRLIEGFNLTLDNVIKPLNVSAEYVDRISKGDIPPRITDTYNGDFNEIKNNLNVCIDAIGQMVADGVGLTQSMLDGKLAARADASKHQGDFRKLIEGFNLTLDNVIKPLNVSAEYVDRISKGDIPPRITDNYNGDFNEIKNNLNVCIDAIGQMVADGVGLTQSMLDGKLAARADASKHQGDFRRLIEGFNLTLDNVIKPLNVSAEYVDRISKGDVPPKITDTYVGDFNEIKNNLNVCIDAVNAMVADGVLLTKAAVEGKLATRADATKHQGDFRKVVEGVNATLDAVIGPLNVSAEYVDRISKGDIPPRITDNYNGDFNEIKNNLNNCIDNINALVAETGVLIKASADGQLSKRADASKHQGEYRRIVEGVNQMLDEILLPIGEGNRVLSLIRGGNLREKVDIACKGDHAKMKDSINGVHAWLSDLVAFITKVANGDMSAAMDIRTILSKTLMELGFEVREAANGKEALEVIQAEKTAVTLILVDWNMPEMNGLDLLKRLRQNPEFSSLVVVMVTAETELDHIAEALEAGANEYVMKPFTKDIIIGKLQLAGIQTCGA